MYMHNLPKACEVNFYIEAVSLTFNSSKPLQLSTCTHVHVRAYVM